jgi:hypothetical protein
MTDLCPACGDEDDADFRGLSNLAPEQPNRGGGRGEDLPRHLTKRPKDTGVFAAHQRRRGRQRSSTSAKAVPMTSGTSERPLPSTVAGAVPGAEDRHRRVRRRSSLLWQHDFRLLWFGETVSKCGSEATAVALPLVAVSTLRAGPFAVGVLTAATWLPWLLVSLPAGAWVDRFTRRPIMVSCNVVSAVLFGSVPVTAWVGLLGVAHLLAVAFCAGVAKVFFRTAYRAYLPTVVEPIGWRKVMRRCRAARPRRRWPARGSRERWRRRSAR